MLTNFIYISKIHSNQCTNCLLMEEKKQGLKNLKGLKAFIDNSQTIHDAYENYILTKKKTVSVVSDNKIADMEVDKKIVPLVIDFFFKRKGTQISTSMPPIPPTVARHPYKDATHASMLPRLPRPHALARHPCKHATHATHAGSYSTPFLKLDNLSWFSFQMNSKPSEQVHTHYH